MSLIILGLLDALLVHPWEPMLCSAKLYTTSYFLDDYPFCFCFPWQRQLIYFEIKKTQAKINIFLHFEMKYFTNPFITITYVFKIFDLYQLSYEVVWQMSYKIAPVPQK